MAKCKNWISREKERTVRLPDTDRQTGTDTDSQPNRHRETDTDRERIENEPIILVLSFFDFIITRSTRHR